MANAYAVAQFFGWEWGRHKKPWEAPRFTLAWIALFLLALAIVLTGVDPMTLVEYAVLFSILVLPLTYLPLMLLAGDKSYMGEHANGRLAKSLGWLYFVIVTVAAIAAVPLYFLTSGGAGMKPTDPIKLVSQLLDLPIHRQGRPLLRHRRRYRARRSARARRRASRLCSSGPAPITAGCPRWAVLPWSARSRAIGMDARSHRRDRVHRQRRAPQMCRPRVGLHQVENRVRALDPAQGSHVMRLTDLRDKKVVTLDGETLGRVHEVHCDGGRTSP